MAEPAPVHPVPLPLSSDARDAAVARLSTAFADGALEMEEFERRAAAVFHASAAAELDELVADLPAPCVAGTAPATLALSLAPRALLSRVTALFAGVERGGALEIPGRLTVHAFFGDVELDLSRAHFTAPVTEVSVHTVGSRVSLRLPAGAVIDNQGSGTLASFACRAGAPRVDGRTEAPRVRILVTGHALLGSVEIETASRAWVLATRPND